MVAIWCFDELTLTMTLQNGLFGGGLGCLAGCTHALSLLLWVSAVCPISNSLLAQAFLIRLARGSWPSWADISNSPPSRRFIVALLNRLHSIQHTGHFRSSTRPAVNRSPFPARPLLVSQPPSPLVPSPLPVVISRDGSKQYKLARRSHVGGLV